jgi:hypothetical protein
VPLSSLPPRDKLPQLTEAQAASTLLFPGGDCYTGGVNAKQQRHGEGIMRAADGAVLQRGVWKDDKLISELQKEEPAEPVAPVAESSSITASAYADTKPVEATAAPAFAAAPVAAAPAAVAAASPAARALEVASTDCVICLDHPRDCLIDCDHFCLCFECAQGVKQCPVCRVVITQRRRLILA